MPDNIKALFCRVYRPEAGACANGGASDSAEGVFVACADGPYDVKPDDPLLYRLRHVGPHLSLVPQDRKSVV